MEQIMVRIQEGVVDEQQQKMRMIVDSFNEREKLIHDLKQIATFSKEVKSVTEFFLHRFL
ncbi:hypothetical protein EDM59_18535 [Brevibacillus nitrificans]|uniref:Uncharacterized protein n=1 Tax=Brevibacillus nitrificans TaxID=651560 RepID=A0A3M8D615_9BACL|nr:hypothetical protein [Brevibacillus nitrificans]RNB83041.1 hypothetical protein EDM59_18535 [Brevibacillus nitrificans]